MHQVWIQIPWHSRKTLERSVPENSAIWHALRYARPVQPALREYAISCNLREAETLLQAARRCCPQSARLIELALQN
jgi:hypothetical protein